MSARSEPSLVSAGGLPIPRAVKIVVSGGFGVGKTTFVSAISEIEPLVTEAPMTDRSVGVDDTHYVTDKTTTTVALDFGRISLADDLILYLFGTPGQDRFSFLWDDLVDGALGAVVLIDTQRLADSFPTIDYFEQTRIPFLLAVNGFDGAVRFALDEVREALDLPGPTPLIACDARDRDSVKEVLIGLLDQVILRRPTPARSSER